jgi:hypothetical protein
LEAKFNSEINKSDKYCVSIFLSTAVTVARTSHHVKNASRATREIMELDADEESVQVANIAPAVQWEGTEGEML